MTWEEYKKIIREQDDEAKELLELAEVSAQITVAMCEAREMLGISQRDLAQRSGLAQSVIARFESGVSSPRLDTLVKMLSPLGLKLQAVKREMDFQPSAIIMDTLTVALVAGKAKIMDSSMDWTNSGFKEVSINV